MHRINKYHLLYKKKRKTLSGTKKLSRTRKEKKTKTTYIQTVLESKRKIRS